MFHLYKNTVPRRVDFSTLKVFRFHNFSTRIDNQTFDFNLLNKIPLFQGALRSEVNISKLGGWANTNYSIDFSGKKYILRIPGVETNKYINRKFEQENTEIAYALRITAK